MKTYRHLWDKLTSHEYIDKAFKKYAKGRTRTEIVLEYRNNKEIIADRYIRMANNYPNYKHKSKQIYDGVSRKKRTIIVPKPTEQVLHHMAIAVLEPIFMKSMYEHSYGSVPKRGCLSGKKTVDKWIRNDYKGTKYYLKMDIRKYFENVSHEVLKEKLSKKIKDDKFLEFVFHFIDVPVDDGILERGIPLGFYPSQWFANFYLTDFDHYVKEILHAKHYIRYMDDLVIFGPNKRKLIKMVDYIKEYLKTLELEIKPDWRVVKLGEKDGQDLDFMGYRFYRNRTTLRRKVMYKATRRAVKISKKKRPNEFEARQMMSYIGRFRHADVYGVYLKRIKPFIKVKKLKNIIRYADKRRDKACGNLVNALAISH